ncbi:2-oxoisovalerate dehydrogenase E2 component (dihydrolipoyl transacylase) [Paenibacillus phyllosphaerae]|uniref:2-oxoisovalerate dehydrogenase E2 component (Dihydrolipoyl transacylase) n=1 Tax=Paenibacillus phyllosphaerae TaxID=274593 RepID=A0A7W5AWF0_9BACL|nr:2-oxoisovalerate dehydrogenase E2 component (dihydrolipoyl transacylase) [Paenibacillus phyllosphaerae]
MTITIRTEAEMNGIVSLHEQVKEAFCRKEGIRLTYMPFFLHAVVNSLKECPEMNAGMKNGQLVVSKNIHLAIAAPNGDWPVVRHADRRSIAGFAIELDRLFQPAKDGQARASDAEAGSFTVRAAAAFSYAIHEPELPKTLAPMLTFEMLPARPAAVSNVIAVRHLIGLHLKADARVQNEDACSRFVSLVKQHVERIGPKTLLY